MKLTNPIASIAQLSDKAIMLIIIALAFITRLICLFQLSDAPFFDQPIGDTQVYFKRAQDILSGNIRGDHIPYFSSPYYSVVIALAIKLFSNNYFLLRLVHLIPGIINCVLIYLLAKELMVGKAKSWAFLAAMISIGYGSLTYFDNKLLPTAATLLFINLALFLLIQVHKQEKSIYAWLAGLSLGLAITDKMNLLLVVPLAGWFLLNKLSFNKIKLKGTTYFLLGLAIVILPITINNYLLEKDVVLLASNGGANLYIGNNSHSQGVFQLPPSFNMDDLDMQQLAEKAVGKKLKPSQASRYWAGQALEFLNANRVKAIKLIYQKASLILNAYEIPNHLDIYFVKKEFAPVLRWLFISFGLIMPMALFGMVHYSRSAMTPVGKLYLGYLLIYVLSLLPFFITARYRVLIMPLIIIFSVYGLIEFIKLFKHPNKKKLILISISLLVLAYVVNRQPHVILPDTQPQLQVANTYMKRGLSKDRRPHDMEKAILKIKQVLEINPMSMSALYNLAYSYEVIGYYSGARQVLDRLKQLYPDAKVDQLIRQINIKFNQFGDKVKSGAVPVTRYEQARHYEKQGDHYSAIATYQQLVKEQVFHIPGYNNLGQLYLNNKDYVNMALTYKQALKKNPNNVTLLSNLGAAYFYMGKKNSALKLYKKCLRLKPNNNQLIKQIETIEQL